MRVGSSPPVWQRGQQASASSQVAAADGASLKLQQQTAKAGGCSASRAKGSKSGVSRQLIAGLAGGGVVRRKPDGLPSVDRKRATADASRRLATGRAERNHADPSRGSRPTVEPECGAVGASRKFRAGAARGGSGSESCRFAAGGAGGRDSRLYYATIKIETPEASVSGVFNLGAVFPAHLGRPRLKKTSDQFLGLSVHQRQSRALRDHPRHPLWPVEGV